MIGPVQSRTCGLPLLLAASALAAAMLLGGSGSLRPAPEIVLQCLIAALTAAWVWAQSGTARGLSAVPREAWIVVILVVMLPLCQLLPLPPGLWHSLPGRATERQALALVGQADSWRPWSLTPDRTLAALLVMSATAALLAMAAAQDRRGRSVLLAVIAGLGMLSVLAGAAQLSGGAGGAFRFYNANEAFLDGFQNNHNAEADVLLITMVALAAVASDWADRRRIAAGPVLGAVGGASLLLILAVVLTASRAGIALLPIAIAAQALILRQRLRLERRRAVTAMAMAACALLLIGVLAVGDNAALARVIARFRIAGEMRPDIWRDALFALRQSWPWGTGMGSFVPVFAAAERLEVITGRFVNRAHDDYLEFLIEAGLPGLIVFLAICREVGASAWRTIRQHRAASSAQMICGAANLVILALHAMVDYPLRTMALAGIAATSVGLLLPVSAPADVGTAKEP